MVTRLAEDITIDDCYLIGADDQVFLVPFGYRHRFLLGKPRYQLLRSLALTTAFVDIRRVGDKFQLQLFQQLLAKRGGGGEDQLLHVVSLLFT